jgi:hypothetical protein
MAMWLKLLAEILLRNRLLTDRAGISSLVFGECLISFDYLDRSSSDPKAVTFFLYTQIRLYGLVLKPKAGCSLLFYFKSAINPQFTVWETRCAE